MIKLYSKFLNDYNIISDYYNYLVELTKNNHFVGPTNEWIIDNYYCVAENKNSVCKALKEDKSLKRSIKKYENVYSVLLTIFEKYSYNVDKNTLVKELNSYQNKNNYYFSYEEVETINIYIVMIVVSRLSLFSISRKNKEIDKIKAENIIDALESEEENGYNTDFFKYIKLDNYILEHPVYLYNLSLKLKEFGSKSSDLFSELNKFLEKNNVNIKDVIKNEHESSVSDNILVSNLFGILKNLTVINFNEWCIKISKTEKLLQSSYLYKNMTLETKQLYRDSIVKNSKRCIEYEYVSKILDKSLKNDVPICNYLFKKKNYKFKYILYILLCSFLSIALSFFLSGFLLDLWYIAFILLLIPISEVVFSIVNKIFMFFNREEPIAKMDYSSSIPKDCATMVVIPTIIKDTKKIDDMFDSLEKIYLSNKSNNLYFSLVADAKESSEEHLSFDELISEHGLSKSNSLNKKYGKDIFYFMYRKRVYNPSSMTYLGFERKRGAIIHFNRLLLGKMSDLDKQKYVYSENISMLKSDIKYVVTIDSDTVVSFGTISKLVGAMNHPNNRPVLNKSKNKVIKGYGIIAPKISVDIESTNKSLYSQLFAGIGGFDIYSSIVPNFYQDVFGEGSFVGKGIYDLKVFDFIFENRFRDNTILSHDLLEGNFLRCGFASDIDFFDDFPSQFLVDMSRQHRWTRGDIQILPYIKRKIVNRKNIKYKNPLNFIEKFKIIDNVRRELLESTMFLLLLLSFIMGNPFNTLLSLLLIISLPIIFYIKDMLRRRRKNSNYNYYSTLSYGFSAIVSRVFINFITIPYMAYLRLDAIFRSLYRMLISHKKMLDWLTAEDASKSIKCDVVNYVKAFKANYIFIAFLTILCIITQKNVEVTFIVCLSFFIAPFMLYLCSIDFDLDDKVSGKDREALLDICIKTFKYFENLLTKENNYLIPDNYQENREIKCDFKTSPTDVGMSLVSIVSAYELGIIPLSKAAFYIEKITESLEKLEKWNGLFYNWINIHDLSIMEPLDISSVDNGNLAASLLVVYRFLDSNGYSELSLRVQKIFDDMNFKCLYTKNNVFSIAYNLSLDRLSPYNYNKFASESRILSFVAIIKGDVPFKHWLSLDKSLTKYKNYKGLASWSGTSFEYFMPYIFMKSYPNTLLDESYFFAQFCEEEYMMEVDKSMPWGISEAAYGEMDDALNYKYKAFSTPYLKVQEDKKQRIVISPYASILAIDTNPESVVKNITKLKKIGLYGDLGFYESYDYDEKCIVLSYFAHHQGMILASLCNYLKNGVIRNYFHSDTRVLAFEMLLKEKVQLNPVIDMKIYGYKRYNYEKESVQNDIRSFNHLSLIPEVSVLSNSNYMLLVNDRGNGFSRYENIQLNRYRKITEQNYGSFIYIRDRKTGKFWSNTYSPTLVKPSKYNIVFASDRITFVRSDDFITTKTEIIVTKEHNAEIRKVTLKNNSLEDVNLDITTYLEPIVIQNIEDITHKTFKNLFIKSEFNKEHNALIVKRFDRNKKVVHYFVNRLIAGDGDYSFETERANFIGRGRNTDNPLALYVDNLSNTCGDNVDPAMSIRKNVIIPAKGDETVYFISGYGKSREQINSILSSYYDEKTIKNAFKYANVSNTVMTKLLDVTGPDMRNYNIMLNYLYQTSRHFISKDRIKLLARNSMNQTNLWKFGITGDYPIILVEIRESESLNLVREVLKAYEYYKSRAIFIDIVIVNYESSEFIPVVSRFIEKEKYRMYSMYDFFDSKGEIFLIDGNNITSDEITLLNMVARLRFDTKKCSSLSSSIKLLQSENKMVSYDEKVYYDSLNNDIFKKEDLLFYNGYGGFSKDGLEYVITNVNTPVSWSNVLANDNFGSIVTNNGCGFTYAYNSQMFKITSWTNDVLVNDMSEGIKVNDKFILPVSCVHGFGYSIFVYETSDFRIFVTQFVALNDTVKFYRVNFVNKNKDNSSYKITFFINPTFGANEEKSSRYLLSSFDNESNSVFIRNVYNINFSDVTCFMSSTLDISEYDISKILFKTISVNISDEDKDFAFLLGCERELCDVRNLISKYNSVDSIDLEFKKVKDYYNKLVSPISCKTPDDSFNIIIKWLIYQTISSRLKAKAGFYQVGGAFGFRDQLQDAMNLCFVYPEITKRQILINSEHQFMEGDVLHWWHDLTKLGLRSRYKDDYLWLVYATVRYINVTGDVKILDIETSFAKGDLLNDFEEERGMYYESTSEKMTILEHCLLAIRKSMREIGDNGLPLMGGGDWNDGMNKVGIKGKGTSVWLGFFLYLILDKFSQILEREKNMDVSSYREFMKKLKESLNKNAWDKDYYLRAFFDNGNPLGSSLNDECKIDLISQSFSILSSVIDEDKIPSVIKSVENNLVDNDLKIIKLLTPAFEHSKDNPGYIMDYSKGIRENGGQYTHATAWYIMALIKTHNNDLAYKYFSMINPINRSSSMNCANIYKVEPYVIAADIYSNENHKARGGWTWYTGSSGWFYYVAICYILGLERCGNVLRFKPNVPESWNSFEIKYRYLDTTYKIKINFSDNNDIVLDGDKINKDYITLKTDKRIHTVIVNIRRM